MSSGLGLQVFYSMLNFVGVTWFSGLLSKLEQKYIQRKDVNNPSYESLLVIHMLLLLIRVLKPLPDIHVEPSHSIDSTPSGLVIFGHLSNAAEFLTPIGNPQPLYGLFDAVCPKDRDLTKRSRPKPWDLNSASKNKIMIFRRKWAPKPCLFQHPELW